MFEKGKSGNPTGKKPGTQNRATKAIKEAFLEAFERRGGVEALLTWAESNETEFYRLASKLIPTESKVEATGADGAPLGLLVSFVE